MVINHKAHFETAASALSNMINNVTTSENNNVCLADFTFNIVSDSAETGNIISTTESGNCDLFFIQKEL